jgi:hypothetical protein
MDIANQHAFLTMQTTTGNIWMLDKVGR